MADVSDSEDSFSSSPQNPEQILNNFRQKWKQELVQKQEPEVPDGDLTDMETIEERAQALFLQGVELEKQRKVYEAIKLYRRAIQLVPDIEFRVYENKAVQPRVEEVVKEPVEDEEEDVEDLSEVDLVMRFQAGLLLAGRICQRSTGDRTIMTGSTCHFCDLPMEIILYIFRWVVSNDLDVRSLDTCSQVCRGFYLCARDAELWRAACTRVWGVNVGALDGFMSWRDMFYERPRVLFSGCYISKTSYLRMGENNFQDHFYAPIHLVEYYRLMRFYPDGTLIMLTSSEDPQISVAKLRNKTDATLHRGHYRLINDQVMIVLKVKSQPHERGRRRKQTTEEINRTFYIELKIGNSNKRRFCKLEWSHYALTQVINKREIESEFELSAARYPPFWFSRVKSYHSEADAAL